MAIHSWILAIAALAFACCCHAGGSPNPEKELIRYILDKTDGSLGRPVRNPTKALLARAKLFLNQIINEPDNSITVSAFLLMVWQDEFIGWNPSHFGGKARVSLPVKSIWHPDVYSIKDNYIKFNDQWSDTQQLWVYSNGTVAMNVPFKTRNLCDCRKGSFKKSCTLQLGSWSYDSSELKLKFLDGLEDFDMGQYAETTGIKIVSHSAEKVIEPYDQPRQNTLYYGLNYNLIVKLFDVNKYSDYGSSSSQQYSKKIFRRSYKN